MSRVRHKIFAVCIVAALAVCAAASADPPDRVGRLNLIQGGVSFRPGNTEEWTAATLNYPLRAGDGLWTEESSRAEVHVGSTAIRLGPRTAVSFLELDDQRVLISLPQGLLNVRLRQLDPDETFAIVTPTMSVSLLDPGSYRIEVGGSGDTRTTVNQGEIEAVVAGLSYPLRANQTAFAARSDPLSIQIRKAPARDEWDQWCAQRDSREDHLSSIRYVPRTMTGCEDLDWYGSWSHNSDYGPVWTPSSLPAGWAPYRYGRWAWVEPWGWTWIDDAPWGFAPFHYGRWARVRGVWVWVPGSFPHRPVYAPALVVFNAAGPGITVRNGNLASVQVDTSGIRLTHRDRPSAFTVVSRQSFRQVQGDGTKAPVVPQVVPQRERVQASSRAPDVCRPPERTEPREVVVRNTPQVKQAQQGQKGSAPQTAQKRYKVRLRKKLPNGQWVWVEEWVKE